MKLLYAESPTHDPYYNLALEEYLMRECKGNEFVLYLWRNEKTVVIGRNQDASAECDLDALKHSGVCLARRNSGGGAVYHDLGNLNFTFISSEQNADVRENIRTVITALETFGINAEFSGRNDILLDGRKFSGSAVYKSGGICCHHGTIMIDVDKNSAEQYLRPSDSKLKSKGVSSVRSRVINLIDVVPTITIEKVMREIKSQFEIRFGSGEKASNIVTDSRKIERFRRRFSDKKFIFGSFAEYTHEVSRRFSWGELTIKFSVQNGRLTSVDVFSDAMSVQFPNSLKNALSGICFDSGEMYKAVIAVNSKNSAEYFMYAQTAEWLGGEFDGR